MKNNDKINGTLKSIGTIILLIVAFFFSRYSNQGDLLEHGSRTPAPINTTGYENLHQTEVLRVVDGDTLIVRFDGQDRRLRLIGIDAPESVSDHPERITREGILASANLKALIENYKGLYYLEFDKESHDQYDRLLGYLWMEEVLLNEKLCYDGFAYARSYPPNVKYDAKHKAAEQQAKQNQRGIWGDLDELERSLRP